MKRTSIVLASAALLGCCKLTLAEAPAGVVSPEDPAVQALENHILPELTFDKLPLDQVVAVIRDQMGISAVVIPSSPSHPYFPILPKMTLTNVTLGQFFKLIEASEPEVHITVIPGPKTPLFCLTVTDNPQNGNPPPGAVSELPSQVHVFRLDDILNTLAPDGSKEAVDKAFQDLATVIEQTLSEVPGGDKPDVKFHEATRTLIFKGDPDKFIALNDLVSALTPKDDDRIKSLEKQTNDLQSQNDKLERAYDSKAELADNASKRQSELQERIKTLEMENFKLKYQIEYGSPTTKP